MSIYEIRYACGHTRHVRILGPRWDRVRKATALGAKPCDECAPAPAPSTTDVQARARWLKKLGLKA